MVVFRQWMEEVCDPDLEVELKGLRLVSAGRLGMYLGELVVKGLASVKDST